MSSRIILLFGFFLLGCLVLVGSAAIHLAVGSEGAPALSADRKETPRSTPNGGARPVAPAPERPAAADTLEALLDEVGTTFAVDSASVSDASIALYAEMITILNREAEHRFVIEVVEPDQALATERAESLRNALLLNVRNPSRLEIVAAEGRSTMRVEAMPYHSTTE